MEKAIEMINAKREAAEKKIIKTFDKEPDLQILNGRYGPYIAYQKKNYKIPESVEPKDLNLETCFKVIELQKEKSEYSMFISMAVCICIFIYILGKVETVINFAKKMQTFVAVDQTYITLILKMVGITYVAEFAMNICKDAGYAAVGNQIELFAKLSILVLSIPVLTVFLETVGSFL